MARMHYRRDRKPIPDIPMFTAIARYYKRVWNTSKGAATAADAWHAYHELAL